MKLYQRYKAIIDEIKPVEVAWFTTFNIDPELVEKYLLSCIAGKKPSDIKTAEDYEALNNDLAKIDIRIWYDYRALNLRNPKFTCINFTPIDPSEHFRYKRPHTIFHPKVIFLKGERGAYLIAGSANLSISAWSSNLESVLIRKVYTYDNAQEILGFFGRLKAKTRKLNAWAAQLGKEESGWHFISSLDEEPRLLNHIGNRELIIWSPYFSKKTSNLLEKMINRGYQKISLVPYVDENGKIGIPQEEIDRLVTIPVVEILKTTRQDENQGLHHAKVWLTSKKIAVGSWNCSRRAIGIDLPVNEQNIEAGIIADITEPVKEALLKNISHFNKKEDIRGSTIEELDRQWQQVLNDFSISVTIVADWEYFKYELLTDYDRNNEYYVSMPHNPPKRIPLHEVDGISFREDFIKVLKNKLYVVFNAEGKTVFQGYLQEKKTNKRPVYSYVSLTDLLESLFENPIGTTAKKKCRYKLESEESIIEDGRVSTIEYRSSRSYYVMFVSFQNLFDKIEENKNNKDKLDKLGFRLPSSIIYIKQLVEEAIQKALNNSDEDDLLFHYFLFNETNRCIVSFNQHSKSKVPLLDEYYLAYLKKALKFTRKDEKFLNRLRKDFGYVSI